MKILVTGANGFLGKAAVKKLSTAGHKVVAFTRTPFDIGSLENVTNHLGDVSCKRDFEALPDNIEAVIHLAQSNHYKDFPKASEDILDVNVLGGMNVLEYACRTGVKSVSIASSGSVYAPSSMLLSEDDHPLPTDFYGASKYAMEVLAKPYSKFYALSVFRVFRLYGPGQNNSLIPMLFLRIQNGQSVTVNGNKGIEIASTHVNDAASIFETAVTKNWNGTFNMASPFNISFKDLCLRIGEVVSKQIIFDQSDECLSILPDIKKLSQIYPVYNMKNIKDELDSIFKD